jgi:hypothetical protein
MATEEALVEVLQQVALGDPDATAALARYLAQSPQQVPRDPEREQQIAAREQRAIELEHRSVARAYFRDNFPDLANDEELMEDVQKDVVRVRSQRPDLSQLAVVKAVGEYWRENTEAPEDRGRHEAINSLAAARSKQPAVYEREEIDPRRLVEVNKRGETEEQRMARETSEDIAEIARNRRGHINYAVEAAAERESREPQRERMRRAVEFPER